ncbi:MAG: hypothetical protein V1872_11950, partial [bacterium]
FPELRFKFNRKEETQDVTVNKETTKKEFNSQYTFIKAFKLKFNYKDTLIDDLTNNNSDTEQDTISFDTSFKHTLLSKKFKLDGDYKIEKDNDKNYSQNNITTENKTTTHTARGKITYLPTRATEISTNYDYKLTTDHIAKTDTTEHSIKEEINQTCLNWLKLSARVDYTQDDFSKPANRMEEYKTDTYGYRGQVQGRPIDWLDLTARYETENSDADYRDDAQDKKTKKDSIEGNWKTTFQDFMNITTNVDVKQSNEKENKQKKSQQDEYKFNLQIEPIKKLTFQPSYEQSTTKNYLSTPEKEDRTATGFNTNLNLDITPKLVLKLSDNIQQTTTKVIEEGIITSTKDKTIENDATLTWDPTTRINIDTRYTYNITDSSTDDIPAYADKSYSLKINWTILKNLKLTSSFTFDDKGAGGYDEESIDSNLRYNFLRDWNLTLKYKTATTFSSPAQENRSMSVQLKARF